MAADDQVWQAWWFAANNEQDYAVSDKERTNKTKFSAYILKVKCSTEENKDGCCFKSKSKRKQTPFFWETLLNIYLKVADGSCRIPTRSGQTYGSNLNIHCNTFSRYNFYSFLSKTM